MALYGIIEFAEICGVSKGFITMNKRRGKVVYSENGGIDDSNPINQAFLQRRLAAKDKREAEQDFLDESEITPASTPGLVPMIGSLNVNQIGPKLIRKAAPAPAKAKPERRQPDPILQRKFELETQKTEAQVAKIRLDSEILEASRNKMAGKLIPTDLVVGVFQQNFKSFIDSFKNGVDNILTEVAKKARLSRNDVAELRGAMIKIINKSVDEGVDQSLKTVKNIVTEYSRLK